MLGLWRLWGDAGEAVEQWKDAGAHRGRLQGHEGMQERLWSCGTSVSSAKAPRALPSLPGDASARHSPC